MNLLIISKNFPNECCGVGDYTYNLVRKLVQKYENICIFVITSKMENVVDFQEQNIYVLPIVEEWNFSCISVIVENIKKIKPSWVLFQYVPYSFHKKGIPFYFLFLLLRVKFFSNIAVFFHEVAIEWGKKPKYWLISFFQRLIAHVICLLSNKNITSNANSCKVLLPHKLEVIHIGSNVVSVVDKKAICLRKEELKKDYDIVFAMFGNLRMNYLVLPALSELSKKGMKWKLLLIGNYNQNNSKRFFDYAEELKITNYIETTGYLSSQEVYKHLLVSDIFFSIDTIQGGIFLHSGALSAAFSASLITIGNKGYLTDKKLEHEKNIILLQNISTEEILFYIEKIFTDKHFHEKIQKQAIEFYNMHLSWNIISKKYAHIFGIQKPAAETILEK